MPRVAGWMLLGALALWEVWEVMFVARQEAPFLILRRQRQEPATATATATAAAAAATATATEPATAAAAAAATTTTTTTQLRTSPSVVIGIGPPFAAAAAVAATAPTVLPMCDDLMRQQPDSPFRDGAFLASHATPIRWVPRRDGSRQLELLEICRLKRYTSHEANTCLADKHVSMIGDSLTRYQYLSLAYFLEHGTFPPRFPQAAPDAPTAPARCLHVDETGRPTCSPAGEPNVCVESDWDGYEGHAGWDGFYAGMCGGTAGAIMNGRMECRSDRIHPEGVGMWGIEMHEAAVYSHPRSRAVLSFAFEAGWGNDQEAPIHGLYFTNCTHGGTCRRTAQDAELIRNRTSRRDFDFSQPFPEAIGRNGVLRAILPTPNYALVRTHARRIGIACAANAATSRRKHSHFRHCLLPTEIDLQYNRGIWGRLAEDRAKRIFPILRDWVGAAGPGRSSNDSSSGSGSGSDSPGPPPRGEGRCFFKSTTATPLRGSAHDAELRTIRPHALWAGCAYLDFAHLTEAFAEDSPQAERHSVFVDNVRRPHRFCAPPRTGRRRYRARLLTQGLRLIRPMFVSFLSAGPLPAVGVRGAQPGPSQRSLQ
jgi:hypothetical protein